MQSENFDKKIKNSLSQRPPGKDNPAWDKMETLLDKHLPAEKKDRRKIILVLFLFLLTTGGALLIWQNSSRNKNNITSTESQNKKLGPAANSAEESSDVRVTTPLTTEKENVSGKTNSEKGDRPDLLSQRNIHLNNDITRAVISQTKKNVNRQVTDNTPGIEETSNGIENKNVLSDFVKSDPVEIERSETAKEEVQIANAVPDQKVIGQVPPSLAVEIPRVQKQKTKSSFLNNLFFAVSAGPDLSGVGGEAGDVQLAWGAGIGYQISNRFSIRTGLYSARKVYTADPEDYHPPYNFWQYYPNLESIDADCKVLEIPITVDYVISQKQKASWFVSAGASTLLMKEETYEYYFKPNNSSNYVTYTKTYNNENKHYFSTINISGGYTRVLNKTISLRAEPYMKFAIEGIGFGKVDLNSGGVLFSAVIKPFAPKK